MKREIREKQYEYYKKSVKLRGLQFEKGISYEKGRLIQREQNECHDKYLFFKNVINALNKEIK